jgi:Domain of unknown function (DUF5916)/Carbohydrate family 9 binding domain-like
MNSSGIRILSMIAALLGAGSSPAQEPTNRPPPGHTRELVAPQVETPPVIDGRVDDDAWKTAAVASDFYVSIQDQWPTDRTEALVTADETHLYIAFLCFDSQPDAIIALDTRRDANLNEDDQVAVELDPFMSYREISSYTVSARGTVSDEIAGGRASQLAWKGEWQGAAVRTSYGWSAEMAIPFAILNRPEDTTTFGINFLRYQNRTREWSQWADTTVRDLPEERGRLGGLSPSPNARRFPLTFMPYVLVGKDVPDRDGEVQDEMLEAGIDIRYQPRHDMTGVLSLYPDFSQVEEAVTDIDFSYNEKAVDDNRPFFQEGSAYFPDEELFYTNRVPDFDYGMKGFTRINSYQIGTFVTRSPGSRIDAVFDFEREFDATHSAGLAVVGTDQSDLQNLVLASRFEGRREAGFEYELEGGVSSTQEEKGDGSFTVGSIGWDGDYWTPSLELSHYSKNYRPELGLLDEDLLDTQGVNPGVSYYRFSGNDELIQQLSFGVDWEYRETGDGKLQRSEGGAGGYIEFRQGIALDLSVSGGQYRPLEDDDEPGSWEDEKNDDHYYSAFLDFNTRSRWFRYGGGYAGGNLGGGDYEYMTAYVKARPTETTSLNINAERVSSFGTFSQVVVTGGWDATPRHGLYTRYIYSDGDDYYRLAYNWRVRTNLDLFAVYDDSPYEPAQTSVKLLFAFP